MAKDVGTFIGTAVGNATREAAKEVAADLRNGSRRPVGGTKGIAAGAGLVVLAPLAAKLVKDRLPGGVAKDIGKKVVDAKDAVSRGSSGLGSVKDAVEAVSGDGDDSHAEAEIGGARRMPVQQAVDVSLPISTVYNQWTQFEDWPQFMHRLDRVSQEDESHVSFETKIWGVSKEFRVEIVEQRPDELIRWRATDGVIHRGVVSFHELAPRLTRVDVDLYVQAGSLIDKAARRVRRVERAVRADLARYKAFVELRDEETGAWRGVIEDAKVKSSRRRSPRRSRSSSKRSSSRSRSSSSGRSRSQAAGGRSRSRSSRARGATNGGSRNGSQRRTRTRS